MFHNSEGESSPFPHLIVPLPKRQTLPPAREDFGAAGSLRRKPPVAILSTVLESTRGWMDRVSKSRKAASRIAAQAQRNSGAAMSDLYCDNQEAEPL